MEEHAGIERIPQGTDCSTTYLHDVYESASAIARGMLESMQALAGTTSCKGVQISALEMSRLGFHSEYDGECYSNGVHDIYDASPNNVLIGVDGRLYFIDTIIYKADSENINIYKRQSPRYAK